MKLSYSKTRPSSVMLSLCIVLFILSDVVCGSPNNGDIRLANSSGMQDLPPGRVEVYYNGVWGTVCGINGGVARTVCRQLGYFSESVYGTIDQLAIPEASNNTEIVLSNVNCDDVDNSFSLGHLHILRCSFQTQVPEYCSHKTDAAVACNADSLYSDDILVYNSAVNLVNRTESSTGVLMIYLNQQWGVACNSGFSTVAADSACRQMGYTNANSSNEMPKASSPVALSEFHCNSDVSGPCLNECFSYPAKDSTSKCENGIVSLSCTFDIKSKLSKTEGNADICTYTKETKSMIPLIVGLVVGACGLLLVVGGLIAVLMFFGKRHRAGYAKL